MSGAEIRGRDLGAVTADVADGYGVKNKDLLDAKRAREEAGIKAAGRARWPYAPKPAAKV
jgi:hypothetical protein